MRGIRRFFNDLGGGDPHFPPSVDDGALDVAELRFSALLTNTVVVSGIT